MGRIILVTGGARSGKSRHAEELAAGMGDTVIYLATARAFDSEMEDRIAKHRQQRPAGWQTYETPTAPSAVLATRAAGCDAVLLDCLTVCITNRLLEQQVDWDWLNSGQRQTIEHDVMNEVESLISAAAMVQPPLIIVTNEVGYGIVPVSPLARFFRDCAGRANQRLAAVAEAVYLVVAGIPVRIKGQ